MHTRAFVIAQLTLKGVFGQGFQKDFLLLDVLQQAGKMKTHRVMVFFDQALERPEAGADQQQRQPQQNHHPLVQA
ncbi:hypothetical protein D3C81_1361840 [compost metagenome]